MKQPRFAYRPNRQRELDALTPRVIELSLAVGAWQHFGEGDPEALARQVVSLVNEAGDLAGQKSPVMWESLSLEIAHQGVAALADEYRRRHAAQVAYDAEYEAQCRKGNLPHEDDDDRYGWNAE